MRYLTWIIMFLFVFSGTALAKDPWDLDGVGDNSYDTTDNVLLPTGPAQVHDLENNAGPTSDQDWYVIRPHLRRSYEVQVTNVTQLADFDNPNTGAGVTNAVTRRSSGGSLHQNSDSMDQISKTRTLRWEGIWSNETILVTNGWTDNTSETKYTIKLYETTLYCPRWNQSGTQTSVLLLMGTSVAQQVGGVDCTYTAYFFGESGVLLGETTGSMDLNHTNVISLATITGLPGFKGGATVAHNCGYGGIAAKLVALEPATGFSFDTPCTYLPH